MFLPAGLADSLIPTMDLNRSFGFPFLLPLHPCYSMTAKSFTLLCSIPLPSQSLILYKHIMAIAEHRATNNTQFSQMLTQNDRQLIATSQLRTWIQRRMSVSYLKLIRSRLNETRKKI